MQGNGPVDDVLGVEATAAGVEVKVATHARSCQYLKDGHGSVTDVADTHGDSPARRVTEKRKIR